MMTMSEGEELSVSDQPNKIVDEPDPLEDEGTAVPMASDPMITVARGFEVKLSELQKFADPLCKYCKEGIVTFLKRGRSGKRVCECARRGYLKHLRSLQPEKSAVTVVKNDDLERERVEKKLKALSDAAEPLRTSLKERTAATDDDVSYAEERVTQLTGLVHREGLRVQAETLKITMEHERVQIELRKHQEILKDLELDQVASLDAEEKARRDLKNAEETLASARRVVEQRLENTAGMRKRLEGLDRRIAITKARYASILGKDDELE